MDKGQEQVTTAQAAKVISIFGANLAAGGNQVDQAVMAAEASQKAEDAGMSFAEIMKRNADNKRRLQEERKRANKNVIRSYRLKK